MLAHGGLGNGDGAVRCRLARHPPLGGSLARSQNESQHILVVNDTEEILDLFRDIIEGLGHRMTAWSFSPDDLAKVTEIEPDLIILGPHARSHRAAGLGSPPKDQDEPADRGDYR